MLLLGLEPKLFLFFTDCFFLLSRSLKKIVKVERVANMLNYFLLQLVGPQRKSLSLKDPEKYEFRPRHLLKQVGIGKLFFF